MFANPLIRGRNRRKDKQEQEESSRNGDLNYYILVHTKTSSQLCNLISGLFCTNNLLDTIGKSTSQLIRMTSKL